MSCRPMPNRSRRARRSVSAKTARPRRRLGERTGLCDLGPSAAPEMDRVLSSRLVSATTGNRLAGVPLDRKSGRLLMGFASNKGLRGIEPAISVTRTYSPDKRPASTGCGRRNARPAPRRGDYQLALRSGKFRGLGRANPTLDSALVAKCSLTEFGSQEFQRVRDRSDPTKSGSAIIEARPAPADWRSHRPGIRGVRAPASLKRKVGHGVGFRAGKHPGRSRPGLIEAW